MSYSLIAGFDWIEKANAGRLETAWQRLNPSVLFAGRIETLGKVEYASWIS